MLYFPRPLPDELLGSLVARACCEIGLSHKELLFAITGVRRTYSSIFLPSYLRQLAALTKSDAEELVFAHSVFPYIVRFMPSASASRLKDLVLSRKGVSDGSFHSLTQSVTNGISYRRLCRMCIEEDQARFGTSYWHRSHMLPAVHYCSIHRQPLEETRILVKNFGRIWSYCMPHEVKGSQVEFSLPEWVQFEIASRSAAALKPNVDYTESWLPIYRQLAQEKGYLVAAPFIAGRRLAEDLEVAYGPDFLTRAGCGYANRPKGAWPALMVRPNVGGPFSPIKHILLYTYLSNCDNSTKTPNYVRPGKKPRDLAKLDAEISKAVKTGLRKWRRDLHQLTLAEFLTLCGCWEQYRHVKKENLPSTYRLVEDFRRANQCQG